VHPASAPSNFYGIVIAMYSYDHQPPHLHAQYAEYHALRLAARGDEDAGSDLDLLVSLTDDRLSAGFEFAARLKGVSSRPVDIAHLARVRAQAPLLLD
jgi:Domain of unknown function (DUF4160)